MSLVAVGKMLKIDGKKHMDRIAQLPCAVCGLLPAAVHHLDTQHKRIDLMTIPLCLRHHQGDEGIHTLGSKAWQERFGYEAELLTKTWAQMDPEYVAEVRALLLADPKIRRRCETRGGRQLKAILGG
jgi:hypothetical protein